MMTTSEPRRTFDMRAAVLAGIIAGLTFVILEMILVPLFLGGSPWAPPRMIAAIARGEAVLQPASFDPLVFLVAVVLYLLLSIIYALILGALIQLVDLGPALLDRRWVWTGSLRCQFLGVHRPLPVVCPGAQLGEPR